MANVNRLRNSILAALSAGVLLLGGCTGDTAGGPGADGDVSGDVFVSTDDSVGKLTLTVTSSSVVTSKTTTFSATVTDASGAPVPQIRVACDTERGLALIEPVTGVELTDSFGGMSGIVGCETPGSLQIGCRLPIGANKRKFSTIKCTGAVPAGFTGFEGAGGGGLFGGVAVPEDGDPGGTGVDGVRISSVSFDDGGDTGTTSIDTSYVSDCDGDSDTVDPEPFTDTIVRFKIENDTNQKIILSTYSYSLNDSNGSGAAFTSKSIALLGTLEIDGNGGSGEISGLMLVATPGGAGGDKYYADSSFSIPTDLGFRNFTFRVKGSNESGDSVTLVFKSSASVGAFNRCS